MGIDSSRKMWESQKYYNESFKLGHRVLLVSHSQGNLFANRIYDKITPTQYKNYFANFQIASPASEVKATKGGYVTLYGDFIINPIPGSMGGNANGSPGHAFVEAYLNQSDPFEKIVVGMKQLLSTLDTEISQWETDQESEPNTCTSKITVKHRFDLAVEMPLDVYPFNGSKKLYQVNGEWVKASCGGENILEQWDGKKNNECLMIDNPQEEKIAKERELKLVEIIHCNLETKNNYRLTSTIGNNFTKRINCGISYDRSYPMGFIGSDLFLKGPLRVEFETWSEYQNAGYNFTMYHLDLLSVIADEYINSAKQYYLAKYPNAYLDTTIIQGAFDGGGFNPQLAPPCSVNATNKYDQGCIKQIGIRIYN